MLQGHAREIARSIHEAARGKACAIARPTKANSVVTATVARRDEFSRPFIEFSHLR
jgi:hypothetical protein